MKTWEMLNKDLNFEECLGILNEMIKDMAEFDCDGDGVVYILVEPIEKQMGLLKKLIPEQKDLESYLRDYGGEVYQEDGIDITGIWAEISARFDKDIRVDFKKNIFYVKD